jgi:ubiquitin carboxyl-terminal hydrolase 10
LGRPERGEAVGGAKPLMDATIRFLDEFAYKDKSFLTQQFLRQATRSKASEGEEDKEEGGGVDPFLPTYVYDAMKEKRQFINMRVRFCVRVEAYCY